MYAGLRLPGDQRQMTPALPMHLVDLLPVGDGVHTFSDASGNSQYFVIYCSFWPNTRFYSNSCEHFSKLFSILQVCTWRTLHLCHQTALVTKGICYRLNVGSFLKFHLLDLFVCFMCNVKVGNDTCSADSHFFFAVPSPKISFQFLFLSRHSSFFGVYAHYFLIFFSIQVAEKWDDNSGS